MWSRGSPGMLWVWHVLPMAGLVVWWRWMDSAAKSWWARLHTFLCILWLGYDQSLGRMEIGIQSSREDWDWTIWYQQHLSNLPRNPTGGGIDAMRTCGVPTVPGISKVAAVPHVPYTSDRSNTWVVHVIKFGQTFGKTAPVHCGMALTAMALGGKSNADRLTCFLLAVWIVFLQLCNDRLVLALQFLLSHGCGLESMDWALACSQGYATIPGAQFLCP